MSHYIRTKIMGGVYFFTQVTQNRKKFLCEEASIHRLKKAFYYTQQKYPFNLHALVILPDHLHCLMELPEKDKNFSIRWNLLKGYFSKGFESPVNSLGEKNLWQRRFWEHVIRDEQDFFNHLDYIYYNPVKHKYVLKPMDWKYSTFSKHVKMGYYSEDWGSMEEPASVINVSWE